MTFLINHRNLHCLPTHATWHPIGSICTTHFDVVAPPTPHVVAPLRGAVHDDGARDCGSKEGPVGRAERDGAVCSAVRLRRIQETRTTGGRAARRYVARART